MKYLFDTNIIIDFLRGKAGLEQKLAEGLRQGFGVSSITLAELYRGAYKSDRVNLNLKLIGDLIGLPEVKLLDFGRTEAQAGGELTGRLEKAGKKLSMGDALIAATAKVNRLTILTEDKHFDRLTQFGIKVEIV